MNDEEKTIQWLLAAPTDIQLNNRAMSLFVRYNYAQWERVMKRAAFELYTQDTVPE
jgi:hypothetical protein